MLLEVLKENVSNSDEWLRRKRRIQFYSRLGVKVLKGVNYLLPIKIDGNVEEMYLMIKLSKNITRISKKSIINYIDSVFTDVYDYRKNDLLNKTSVKLPAIYGIPCDSSNPSSPLFQVLVGRAPDIIPTRLGYIEQVSAPPDMCVYHAQFGFGDPVTDVILKYIANGTISLKGLHSVAIITHDHTSLQRHHWSSFNMGKVLFITGKPTNIDYL